MTIIETISENSGLIGMVVSVVSALVAGAWTLFRYAGGSNDLKLASLNNEDAKRLTALDGHQIIRSEDGKIVFQEGAKVELNLSLKGKGNKEIRIRRMELEIVKFEQGLISEYQYKPAGNEIFGAGTAKVHEFTVTIQGNRVEPAIWVVDEKSARFEQAKSENFLDVAAINNDDDQLFRFTQEDQMEEIRGKVMAMLPGLYELKFRFYYTAGKKDKVLDSDTFYIYKQ